MKNKIDLAGLTRDSIVDGPGLRMTLFTQGCPHRCFRCHNPQTWEFGIGCPYTIKEITDEMDEHKDYYSGITFSGGEPLLEEHVDALNQIADYALSIGWNIWIYTGRTWETIPFIFADLIGKAQVVIDGKFDYTQKSLDLKWRGSANQRVIDVEKTFTQGEIVLWEETTV